ncbi:ABC transporter permease, partial [Escherichia coli]|nr:ABC transporter permease [Escherichia coli]
MFLCLNASEPEAIFFSVNRKIWRARRVIGASLYNIMFHLYFLIL